VKIVSASVIVEGAGIEAEQLWYDRTRWASWIDGFGNLSKLDGDWPFEDSRRVWTMRVGSPNAARGLISEKVRAYAAGDGQTLAFEDERVHGVQRIRFETDNVRTRITVTVDMETKTYLAPARKWWLRRQFRGALQRSLARFAYELAAERDR
jgi:hypothetical protein